MIKTRAYIKLYKDGRKTPFGNGYRPLFNFVGDVKTSGNITLLGNDEFCPGEEGEVEIVFISKEYLGAEFTIGSTFSFGEGRSPLGEGEILSINEIKSI